MRCGPARGKLQEDCELAGSVQSWGRLGQDGRSMEGDLESHGARQPLEELEHVQQEIRRHQECSSRREEGGDSAPYGIEV